MSIVVIGLHTIRMTASVSQQVSSYVIKYGETLLPVVAEGDSLAVQARERKKRSLELHSRWMSLVVRWRCRCLRR